MFRLSILFSRKGFGSLAAILVFLAPAVPTQAQFQITEILYDTGDTSGSSGDWEWIEVLNTGEASASLNGYFLDDDDGTALDFANINTTAEIPAGATGILYNNRDLTDARFRAAWSLAPSVPVIPVSDWPALSNGGDVVGLWPDFATYDADVIEDLPDNPGRFIVVGTAKAETAIDYAAEGFPARNDNSSIYWKGSGSPTDGANWRASELTDPPTAGAYASIETFLPGGTPINSTQDIGNPGIVPGGAAPAKLMITEVMYNPDSPEPTWEWVEIYNNTGAPIDFSDAGTTYYFDDDDNAPLTEKNLASGSIADGGTAILYNGNARTEQEMQDAWGDLNFIPVSEWPGLSNGGDMLGLWNNQADYDTDMAADPEVTDNAEYGFTYDDNPNADPPWPSDNPDGPSIYLTDLGNDPNVGTSWAGSFDGDTIGSKSAGPVVGDAVVDHVGGDVGSPGFIPSGSAGLEGDYDGSGRVDQGDLDLVLLNWGDSAPAEWTQDPPAGNVGSADLNVVRTNWGSTTASPAATAVPEPTSLVLLVSFLAMACVRRHR